MRVEPHHTADELAALIRSESDARVVRRLVAVRSVLVGQRPEDVGPQVMLSARQVRNGVARYNDRGVPGLANAAGRGRKGPLAPDRRDALATRVPPVRPRATGGAPSGARISAASCATSSASSGPSRPWTTSSTPSGSNRSARVPGPRRRPPRSRRRSKNTPGNPSLGRRRPPG